MQYAYCMDTTSYFREYTSYSRVVVRMHTREYTTSSYIIVPYYIILWILQYAYCSIHSTSYVL